QLVDLVRPDAADDRVALPPLQVLLGGGEEGHAGTRLRDLGGRGHAPETIRITRLVGEAEDVVHRRELVRQGVDDVSVVPHYAEVRCRGLQGRSEEHTSE